MCRPRSVRRDRIRTRLIELAASGVDLNAIPEWCTIYDLFRPIAFFSRWMMPPDPELVSVVTPLSDLEAA